jgi:putative DNA primase/helicase
MVLSQAKIKALTQGYGSQVHACRKYENPFSFEPTYKIFLDTNPRPVVRDVDDKATFNRLHAVPFEVTIPRDRMDLDLGRKLTQKEELEGILAWAVEGSRLCCAEGLERPPEVEAATREWREENDNIARFIADRCEIGDYYSESAARLYDTYKAWAEKNKEYILNQKKFAASLEAHGYKKSETKRGRKYHGLKVSSSPLDVDQEEEDDPKDEDVPF